LYPLTEVLFCSLFRIINSVIYGGENKMMNLLITQIYPGLLLLTFSLCLSVSLALSLSLMSKYSL